ncbi:MAG TPA: hypothetical protein VH306_10670 [Gaiellaceae bacterium]|jgi:hypothetical protein
MSPSAVLSEAWELYKRHWQHLLPLALVVYLLLSLLVLALAALLGWLGAIAALLVSIVGTFWLQGALVIAVEDVRDGRADLTIGETLSRVRPQINTLTLAGLLAGIGILIGFALLIVPGLVLLTWWLFIVPVIMLEGASVMESFGRSRDLGRGNGWNVFGLLILTILIILLAQIALSLILIPLPDAIQGFVGNVVSNTLFTPFVAAAWTLGYYHLKGLETSAEAEPATY